MISLLSSLILKAYKPCKVKPPVCVLNFTLLKYRWGCFLSTLKKLPTKGRPNGPGGKFGGFLCLRKSATRIKTKKNRNSALRSNPSKKS